MASKEISYDPSPEPDPEAVRKGLGLKPVSAFNKWVTGQPKPTIKEGPTHSKTLEAHTTPQNALEQALAGARRTLELFFRFPRNGGTKS